MMSPLNRPEAFAEAEADFADIREYLLSLRAAEVPASDRPRHWRRTARRCSGSNCARCHGTYGESWTYPNKIVPLEEIGTDRTRYDGIAEAVRRSTYNQAGSPRRSPAGSADGLHGSGPPATRPRRWTASGRPRRTSTTARCRRCTRAELEGPAERFTRSYRTGAEDYDPASWAGSSGGRARQPEAAGDRAAARCTTRRSPAAATAATPSATS